MFASNPAPKASWNPAGVEPVHWKPADSTTALSLMILIGNVRLLLSEWYKSKKKVYAGSKPRHVSLGAQDTKSYPSKKKCNFAI